MRISFAKMHGNGNDFVVLDGTSTPLNLAAEQLSLLGDRRLGVGCDQILVAEPAQHADADFFYRIYNADGSESGQCGNGARSLARFLRERGLSDKNEVVVETNNGLMTLNWLNDELIRVEMGIPQFEPRAIPLNEPERQGSYNVPLEAGGHVAVQALSVGNPHAVLVVEDVATAPVAALGAELECHALFPERVNVGFMQLQSAEKIALRVYERGAGETLACGSGACAAVIAGRLLHGLAERVQVQLPGGILQVEWQGEGQPVFLTGDATHIYDGEIEL